MMVFIFRLGERVQSTLSGFIGCIESRSENLNGGNRYLVRTFSEQGIKKPPCWWMEELEIMLLSGETVEETVRFKHPLGKTAVDVVTGIMGVIVSREQHFSGSIRYFILPPYNHDKYEQPTGEWIPEIQVDLWAFETENNAVNVVQLNYNHKKH